MKTAKKKLTSRKKLKNPKAAKKRILPRKGQKETEHYNPWSRIYEETEQRHEAELDALISEYEANGDSLSRLA